MRRISRILLGLVCVFNPLRTFLWTVRGRWGRMGRVKWKVIQVEECVSTFDEARVAPPWTVVCARRQTRGRGRFNREWIADEGGLWANYNIPLPADSERNWGLLPLVAGVAVSNALRVCDIAGLRLRWPNDVLVGRAKLAGILVERPQTEMASIGIGINVFNRVAHLSDVLRDPPARLADVAGSCPSLVTLRDALGDSLSAVFGSFLEGGFDALSPMLRAAWGAPKPVVAITDSARYCGYFTGVDPDGSPILRRADGSLFSVPGISIMRLKELI